MAKRKKHHKKAHRSHASKGSGQQKPAQQSAAQPTPEKSVPVAVPAASVLAPASTAAAAPAGRWSYVGRDIRRIGLLVGACVLIEVGLWLLFGHTGLGSTVDSWVKL